MPINLNIDRAVYQVDDETRTYRFLRRNPDWKKLDSAENEAHKRQIDGYSRMFRDGRKKTFRYDEAITNDAARLEATVERFCRLITTLPASTLMEQVWGPKEVLAHLVYHHELYVILVETFLAGRPVEPPKGYGRELNAAAVAASRGVPPDTLVARLQRANQRLVELYRQHDPYAIPVEVRAGAKLRTLAMLVPEVEAHIRNHLEKLRKSLKDVAVSKGALP